MLACEACGFERDVDMPGLVARLNVCPSCGADELTARYD